jgi:hypothetical protein
MCLPALLGRKIGHSISMLLTIKVSLKTELRKKFRRVDYFFGCERRKRDRNVPSPWATPTKRGGPAKLRFGHRDYHKGSSLAEIARHYGLGATDCFAVGDSHNDFEMLDPRNAAKFACPGNAVAEVKAHVAKLGGYLAQRVYGDGAVEALEYYFPGGLTDREL